MSEPHMFAQQYLMCDTFAAKTGQHLENRLMMFRREMMLGTVAVALTACTTQSGRIGPDGLPLPQVYNIGPNDKPDIQFRMLDSVNTLRQAAGVSAVELDPALNAAAETHARDMSVQNRPWLFGSDGSSPLDRAARAGFQGRLLGESISESYETELETLAAWMNDPDTRSVILDANARRMGLGWFQEPAGKLWWSMNMGGDPAASRPIASIAPTTTPVTPR